MKRFLCGVLAALMLVVLCACGKQETATVRLSEVTHSVFYAPQYVALEQGFFADEGLNIELTNGGGADKVMTAATRRKFPQKWARSRSTTTRTR